MAITLEYPVITSNLSAGYGVFGTADPWMANASTPFPNGAMNPVGSLAYIPSLSASGNIGLSTTSGFGAGLWIKYVLYKSTANPVMNTGPSPVLYTDETFTTVTGRFSEGQTATGATVAGWLLPNTGSVAGVGVGSLISATILNNNGNGSYVWIGVNGFIPSTYLAAGAKGNSLMIADGSTSWAVTALTTTVLRTVAYSWYTVGSNIGDIVSVINPC